MKLLAIDTSSLACSVALADGPEIIERHEVQARAHTRLLLPMVRDVLDAAALPVAQLDAVILGNGPGSFIGMRIAASVVQGIAFAADLPVMPVSSLAAVAAEALASPETDTVLVAQDAHMAEVYLGGYRRGADGQPDAVFPERLQGQAAIAELTEKSLGRTVAAGAGWQQYPALFAANRQHLGATADVFYPRAGFLLDIGRAGVVAGATVAPGDIQPAYLRQKVAEKAANRA